jgi:lia operon protein LiaG
MSFGKNATQRIVIGTAIVAGAALLIAAMIALTVGIGPYPAGSAPQGGGRVDESKQFPLSGIGSISIDTVAEDVRIVESSDSNVTAHLSGTVGAAQPEAVPHLAAELAGSALRIKVERKSVLFMGPFWQNLVLEVAIPRSYSGSLSTHTVSGDIDMGDRALETVVLGTTSGDGRTGAISAKSFEWKTTSGDLSAAGIESPSSRISSVSGELTVRALTGDLNANSTSGEVRIDYKKAPGNVEIGTVSGDARIALPADSRFQLNARSTSGDITCDFPITMTGSSGGPGRHSLAGSVGEQPQSRLDIHTVSGEIEIRK